MSSSYAEWLRRGDMQEDEEKLRQAIALISEVIQNFYSYEEDQSDNQAENGVLIGELSIANKILRGTIPPEKS